MSELENLNFDLEEQLMRCSDDDGDKRRRAYTILEASLAEKDMVCGCGCVGVGVSVPVWIANFPLIRCPQLHVAELSFI